MREIKFRAWDTKLKQMLKDVGFDNTSKSDGSLIYLQYTGLKDIKQKEIYESDILTDGQTVSVIGWSNANAGFWALPNTTNAWVDCEVIGNAYENPELLPANHMPTYQQLKEDADKRLGTGQVKQ